MNLNENLHLSIFYSEYPFQSNKMLIINMCRFDKKIARFSYWLANWCYSPLIYFFRR